MREGVDEGDVVRCCDCVFMMIEGTEFEKDGEGGLELIEKGRKLEEEEGDEGWKSDGSATDVLEPQSMDLSRLFW